MYKTGFITAPLSGWLDLIRALAALAVVIGHSHLLGVYTGTYPFSFTFELNAVVVFFVLSGLVIAASADREGMDARRYAAARIARIVPVAWASLAFAYAAAVYCQSNGMTLRPVGMDPGEVSLLRTLRAALFLDESWAAGVSINAPWWSLSCEVWFYVLFGLATWLRGPKRFAALAVALSVAGTNVLLMLPSWLVGVALARLPAARRVSLVAAVALVLLALLALQTSIIPFALLEPITRPLVELYPGHSQFALGYLVLALAIAGGFAGLRVLADKFGAVPAKIIPMVRWAADMSFSLYVLHWPLLILLKARGISADSGIGFAAILALIVATAGVFAHFVEHRRDGLRRWLERLFRANQRISTSSSAIDGCKATV